ncbi:hypothetical protein GCM10028789_08040 [Sinomonas halotolerans]
MRTRGTPAPDPASGEPVISAALRAWAESPEAPLTVVAGRPIASPRGGAPGQVPDDAATAAAVDALFGPGTAASLLAAGGRVATRLRHRSAGLGVTAGEAHGVLWLRFTPIAPPAD